MMPIFTPVPSTPKADRAEGTFSWAEPAETLVRLAQPSGARVLTPLLGRPFEPAHADGLTPWWRGVEPQRSAAVRAGVSRK